jgi:hypothetical protein
MAPSTLPFPSDYAIVSASGVAGYQGKTVKARSLIDGAAFDPNQLKIIGQAFDAAWDEIKPTVSKRATAVEAARLKLANAVLTVALQGPLEVDRIRVDALKAMFAGPPQMGT